MNKLAPAGKSQSRGLWIAVFGPDGVGKSTVIEEVKTQVGGGFSGVTGFHFRPMLGSQRVNHPPVTTPHAHRPRTGLVSLVKLIYWLLDCWCGYLFVIRPGLRRSGLVIFDRYYSDILVDPVRYRLPASVRTAARWLVALAPQPDFCILLDAPSEILQRRKGEVSPAESHRQRLAYAAMFRSIPGGLIVNTDCPVNQAARQVGAAVLARLASTKREQPNSLLIANS